MRSAVYNLTASSSTYTPGELLHLELRVTQRLILGWSNAGKREQGNESSKYIGLLLYAVRTNDASETKVGSWEVPLQTPPKFFLPADPGCGMRAVMHAGAEPKGYIERFRFRAPPAGTGSLTFRALVKQGDTNRGAFYWPGVGDDPSNGVPGGDLVVDEAPGLTPHRPWSYRGQPGQTCTEVCAAAGLTCDEAALQSSGSSAAALRSAVEPHFLCAPPYLATCDNAAPTMSGLGDGLCWFHADTIQGESCPSSAAPPPSLCDAAPSSSIDDGLRLCACAPPAAGGSSQPWWKTTQRHATTLMRRRGHTVVVVATLRNARTFAPSPRRTRTAAAAPPPPLSLSSWDCLASPPPPALSSLARHAYAGAAIRGALSRSSGWPRIKPLLTIGCMAYDRAQTIALAAVKPPPSSRAAQGPSSPTHT